jgi:hypothetical protein
MSHRIRRRNDHAEHDRGRRTCDRKFKPLILSEVQAAADIANTYHHARCSLPSNHGRFHDADLVAIGQMIVRVISYRIERRFRAGFGAQP